MRLAINTRHFVSLEGQGGHMNLKQISISSPLPRLHFGRAAERLGMAQPPHH